MLDPSDLFSEAAVMNAWLRRMGTALLTMAAGALLLPGMGCRPTDACAASESPCGGSPVGGWTLADSCQDPAYVPTLPRTYLGQTATTARQPPPEPASADWCADLKYGPGTFSVNLPRDTPKMVGGYVRYKADGTYGAFMTNSARTSIEFSWSCITRFGYSSTCAEFDQAFASYASGTGGVVKDTKCEDSTNGCRCEYTKEADAAGTNLAGRWNASGSVLTHFAANQQLPSQADFCQDGPDHLTLWGHARSNIFDIPGARTINWVRIPCGNGMVERGEECEPPNTATCDSICLAIPAP